jgi:hypothetical protein
MIYNVVLNSDLRVAGSPINNAGFYFDWSALPRGKYKVSWVFVSGVCNMSTLYPPVGMVEINLGQSAVFRADSTNVQASTTNIIGIVTPNALSATAFLYADLTTNPPLSLAGRPNNNAFTVRLIDNSVPPALFLDSAGTVLPEYVLTLSFELVE